MRKKKYSILAALTCIFILLSCGRHYVRYDSGIGVRVREYHPAPAYRNEYYEDYYYEDYYNRRVIDIEYYPKFYVGTSIYVGNVRLYWCDFCHCWHPRCTAEICYCHPSVVRHYSFHRYGIFHTHCYNWHYDRYYRPPISTYRWKGNGYDISYNINREKRNFRTRKSSITSDERIRYRGKEEITYNFNGDKKRISDRTIRTIKNDKRTSARQDKRTVTGRNRTVTRTKTERIPSVKTSENGNRRDTEIKQTIVKKSTNIEKNSYSRKREGAAGKTTSTREQSYVDRIKKAVSSAIDRRSSTITRSKTSSSSRERSPAKRSSYSSDLRSKSSPKARTTSKSSSGSSSRSRRTRKK